MKKSVFTTLNFYLPAQRRDADALLGQCRARTATSALFFGLSGTGKTTLSADPNRTLIGDDEHGWGPTASSTSRAAATPRRIKLSAEAEPEIYDATNRFGAVLGERRVRSGDARSAISTTTPRPRTRARAYPLDFIPNASRTGRAGHPKNIIFLTADAYRRDAADRQAHAGAGDVSLPVRATPPRSPAPRRAWSASSRNSRPASARRSCRASRRNTATCCATTSPSTTSTAGWSTPAGPAASTASAAACRSRRRARSLTGALDGSLKQRRASAPIPISASRCRPRCRASSRTCSIR